MELQPVPGLTANSVSSPDNRYNIQGDALLADKSSPSGLFTPN
jgi:hypothetical protein